MNRVLRLFCFRKKLATVPANVICLFGYICFGISPSEAGLKETLLRSQMAMKSSSFLASRPQWRRVSRVCAGLGCWNGSSGWATWSGGSRP
jgi:hypothetical protein